MGSQFKGVERLNSVAVKPTVIDVACAVKRKYPRKHPELPCCIGSTADHPAQPGRKKP